MAAALCASPVLANAPNEAAAPLVLVPEQISAWQPSPEQQLRIAVRTLELGDAPRALERVEALLEQQPDFRAAQFLRAQILASRTGDVGDLLPSRHTAELAALAEEVRLRVAPLPLEDDTTLLPSALLRVPPSMTHIVVVDLSAARLFLLRRNASGLHVTRDLYASMGSNGYGKQVEGDNRTPLGIYRVTDWLDGASLPDLYGVGAFPIDYPNDWDRFLGRTGYGIWLHGVPKGAYSRLPRSSEGCVTLSNDDLASLHRFIDVGKTMVVLAERLDWKPRDTLATESERFEQRIDDWRSAWAAQDTERYLEFYSDDFRADGMHFEAFAAHKRRVNAAKAWIEIDLDDLAIFEYPGESGLRMVRFEQAYRSDNYVSTNRKTQYWRNIEGEWMIVRETSDG